MSETTTTTKAPTTYLRIRRQRHDPDAAPTTMRVTGIQQSDAVAVWRRVDSGVVAMNRINDNDKKRTFRVVDAVLHDNPVASKRPRLTLLKEQQTVPTTIQSFVEIPVLTPLERLVDDALQQVLVGKTSIAAFVEWIQVLLVEHHEQQQQQQLLTWCNPEGGNILHACALWNDAFVAAELLQNGPEASSDSMTKALDGEGRTPYQVARMAGHEAVVKVLAAFGVHNDDEDGNTDYRFDLYCLQSETDDVLDDTSDATLCELHGGFGYWDDHGQLILQHDTHNSHRSFSDQSDRDEDEDVDSNDEEWAGNDYPDEEEDVSEFDDGDDPEFDENAIEYERHEYGQDDGAYDAAYGEFQYNESEYDSEIDP
jgi:hypothetical protein